MKKLIGMLIAIAGAVVMLWAGASVLATHQNIFGYHPVYAGLAGVATLVVGLVTRAD